MLKQILFILAIGFLLPLQLSAETKEENAKRAKEILEKANKKNTQDHIKTTFKEVKLKNLSINAKTVFYSKISMDGVNLFRSEKYMVNANGVNKLMEVSICNESGFWNISNGYAIKIPVGKPSESNSNVKSFGFVYEIKDENILNKKQFKIIKTANDEDYNKFCEDYKDAVIPYKIVYTINKDEYIISEENKYSKNGKLINSTKYQNIEFKELNNNLFVLDKSLKIKKTKTFEEYFKMRNEIKKNNFEESKFRDLVKFITTKKKGEKK